MDKQNQIEIYKANDGSIQISVQLEQDTVWLTQAQMAELFETTPQNITMHVKSVYNDQELDEKATCKDFLQVRKEGKRTVKRKQLHYNLDAAVRSLQLRTSRKFIFFIESSKNYSGNLWQNLNLND